MNDLLGVPRKFCCIKLTSLCFGNGAWIEWLNGHVGLSHLYIGPKTPHIGFNLLTVWGGAYTAAAHYLHVHLGNLRRKVEPNPRAPRYLVTEPGVGYRIRSDEP